MTVAARSEARRLARERLTEFFEAHGGFDHLERDIVRDPDRDRPQEDRIGRRTQHPSMERNEQRKAA